jgi:hypothetical protein
MLAVTHGQMVMLSTPNGKQGYFYNMWENHDDSWLAIRRTALDNPRISKEFLEEQRASMSPLAFKTEFMCEFLDAEEQLISTDMIESLKDDSVPMLVL